MPDIVDSRIHCSVDLTAEGRQVGDLYLKWSDNHQPLGHYPIPIACLARGAGPTVLLSGGIHGDEFEGPAVLMRLIHSLSVDDINGRIIILPAANFPALSASSRVSPLDNANMNRAFPGHPDGGPTAMLAHFMEQVLMPQCDAVIDLHSGGQAAEFAPSVLVMPDGDAELRRKNLALAAAFGAPYTWLLGSQNDDRSVNAAAARQKIAVIAAELGGGGGCDPKMTALAEQGVARCLAYLGLTNTVSTPAESTTMVEISSAGQSLIAPARGLFDRAFSIGDEVEAGQHAGLLHFITEPQRPSVTLSFPDHGVVMAHTARGLIERGEMLALVAREVSADDARLS